MKINYIQMEELERARELQKESVDLHLPSPPVVSWAATLIDAEGVEQEKTIAKANSYVRNALNSLVAFLGYPSSNIINTSSYQDGVISSKPTNGSINGIVSQTNYIYSIGLSLGDSLTPIPETVDYFKIAEVGVGWTRGNTLSSSTFDINSRKLISTISRLYTNVTTNTKHITESTVFLGTESNTNSATFLQIRDVFSQIAVGPGQSILFTYQTEVLFPE